MTAPAARRPGDQPPGTERPAAPYSVAQHLALGRVTELALSPDGSWLAVTLQRLDAQGARYCSDLWRVPLGGGPAVQLTRGECRDRAPCFRHDGDLGFLSDRQEARGGAPPEARAERSQVWLLPAEGGEPRPLTDEPLGVEAFAFARRADRLVLLAPVLPGVPLAAARAEQARRAEEGPSARRYTRQPVRHWDHWLHDDPDRPATHLLVVTPPGAGAPVPTADAPGRLDLTPAGTRELAVEPFLDVSEDGAAALVSWARLGADRVEDKAVAVFDLVAAVAAAAAVPPMVLPQPPCTAAEGARFSPDGAVIAVVRATRSTTRAPHPELWLVGRGAGEARCLTPAWDHAPSLQAFARDGQTLIVSADDGGETPLFAVAIGTGAVTRLTASTAAGAHGPALALPDGDVACVRSTLLDAPECYRLPAGAAPGGATPLPLARLSGFEPAGAWAEHTSFTVPSTDGAPVQCHLVRPRGATRCPTLLWIHGGPIGMSTDGWHWRWNPLLLVAAGYAVAQPNPRGSTGFGRAFVDGIWGNRWGDQCFRDLMAVTDALERREDVDPARMVAMGGSFGGYMTNWIGTQTTRFRCLVTHASIVTMAAFTGTTDHPGWWYLEMGGENPYREPERFERFAPLRQIERWRTPTLILHGERDYRCPIGEGLLLFEALQYHGVQSELVVFPDEHHWILKPRNITAWYGAVQEFLGRWM